jgi:hypothetical protein
VGQGLLTMMMKLMIWEASVRLASLDLGVSIRTFSHLQINW